MKIKTKLLAGMVVLAAVPVIVSSAIIGFSALNSAEKALQYQAQQQLVSIRDITASNIEGYFETIKNQVLTFSNDRMIIDATKDFKVAFDDYLDESGASSSGEFENSLSDYYRSQFGAQYADQNGGSTANIDGMLQGLDEQAIALQYAFISNNSYPLGEKDGLISLDNGTKYSAVHEKFHPHIRDFLNRFGYYDIFIVDPDSGNIIYSVYKELDYATSLKDGPYANTGICLLYTSPSPRDS